VLTVIRHFGLPRPGVCKERQIKQNDGALVLAGGALRPFPQPRWDLILLVDHEIPACHQRSGRFDVRLSCQSRHMVGGRSPRRPMKGASRHRYQQRTSFRDREVLVKAKHGPVGPDGIRQVVVMRLVDPEIRVRGFEARCDCYAGNTGHTRLSVEREPSDTQTKNGSTPQKYRELALVKVYQAGRTYSRCDALSQPLRAKRKAGGFVNAYDSNQPAIMKSTGLAADRKNCARNFCHREKYDRRQCKNDVCLWTLL
jgi:hypothetical protein